MRAQHPFYSVACAEIANERVDRKKVDDEPASI